jgi:hypothetical protein
MTLENEHGEEGRADFIAPLGDSELKGKLSESSPDSFTALNAPDMTPEKLLATVKQFNQEQTRKSSELHGAQRSDDLTLDNGSRITVHRDTNGNVRLGTPA